MLAFPSQLESCCSITIWGIIKPLLAGGRVLEAVEVKKERNLVNEK